MANLSSMTNEELAAEIAQAEGADADVTKMSDADIKAEILAVQQQPAPVQKDLSWGDVASGAIQNAPSSLVQLGSDMVQPFAHPIDTAQAVGNLALGGVQKLIPGEQGSEKYADAVGEFFANRYNGMENFKRTLQKDPAGVVADLSSIFLGGGTLAARAPGIAGKVGRAAQAVGGAIDPVMAAAKGAKAVGTRVLEPVLSHSLGLTTGAGGETIRNAARAGRDGGEAGVAFRENMRGDVLPETIVQEAKAALSKMRQERSAAYRQGMGGVAANDTVLNFGAVDNALRDVADIGVFKGQSGTAVSKNIKPGTEAVWNEIADAVEDWRMSDPAEFHTAAGFDALKQKIGDIRAGTDFHSPSRIVADQVYNAIKKEIISQAPEYADVMKGYEAASAQLIEVEKALSLGNKASADTALRKLQSVMRNNANTNFGNRVAHAQTLEAAGAPNLMAKLSGQALNSATPRGIQGAGAAGLGAATAMYGNPAMLPMLGMSSPRIVGEAAHAAGRTARGGKTLADMLRLGEAGGAIASRPGGRMTAFQIGRLEEELRRQR